MSVLKKKSSRTIKQHIRSFIYITIMILTLFITENLIFGYRLYKINTYHDTMYSHVIKLNYHFKIQIQEFKNSLIRGYKNKKEFDSYYSSFQRHSFEFQNKLTELRYIVEPTSNLGLIQVVTSIQTNHKNIYNYYLSSISKINIQDINSILTVDATVKAIDRVVGDLLVELGSEVISSKQTDIQILVTIYAVALMLTFLFFIFYIIFFYNSFLKYVLFNIYDINDQLNKLTENKIDYNNRIQLEYENEFTHIVEGINSFIEYINHFLYKNQYLVHNITSFLNKNSQALLQNSIEYKTSSEQLKSTTQKVMINMDHLYNVADSYCKNNVEFQHTVENIELFFTMAIQNSSSLDNFSNTCFNYIQESTTQLVSLRENIYNIYKISSKMNKAVQLIHDISAKVNLLSLNASVEAARAGIYGRGFAVVADEISKLSDVISESVTDITSLIKNHATFVRKNDDIVSLLGNSIHDSMSQLEKIKQHSNDFYKVTSERKIFFGKIIDNITNTNLFINDTRGNIREQHQEIVDINNITLNIIQNSDKIINYIEYTIKENKAIDENINNFTSKKNE